MQATSNCLREVPATCLVALVNWLGNSLPVPASAKAEARTALNGGMPARSEARVDTLFAPSYSEARIACVPGEVTGIDRDLLRAASSPL